MLDTVADDALLNLLATHGFIDAAARAAIERVATIAHVSAIEALCDGGWMTEDALANLFQQRLHLPRVGVDPNPPIVGDVDPALLRRRLVVPTAICDGRMLLAMANPLDHAAIEHLRFASALRIVPAVALLSEIRAAQRGMAPPEVRCTGDSSPCCSGGLAPPDDRRTRPAVLAIGAPKLPARTDPCH